MVLSRIGERKLPIRFKQNSASAYSLNSSGWNSTRGQWNDRRITPNWTTFHLYRVDFPFWIIERIFPFEIEKLIWPAFHHCHRDKSTLVDCNIRSIVWSKSRDFERQYFHCHYEREYRHPFRVRFRSEKFREQVKRPRYTLTHIYITIIVIIVLPNVIFLVVPWWKTTVLRNRSRVFAASNSIYII